MKLGDTIIISNESFKIIKEYRDAFLAISEFGINLKRIPKLVKIK
jgi:uncharacterized protein YutD